MLPRRTASGASASTSRSSWSRVFQPRATLAVGLQQQYSHHNHNSHGYGESLAGELGWRTDFSSQYVKGRCLGGGSFGVVYQGCCRVTGESVAIKVMPKQRGKLAREKTLEKLEREVSVFERVSGACGRVVELIDCFEEENEVMVISELCSGGDLQKHIDAYGPLDERSLALVAREVLLIIRACHDLGVLHGDIKPANFCKTNPGRTSTFGSDPHLGSEAWLKAIDFGCSQYLVGNRRLTKRTGTPVYMAPEIFQRDYAHAADIWSTGVMLYQLFCRRFPFWDNVEIVKASKLEEVAEAVSSAPILYDFGPWLGMTPEGQDFVQRCLDRDQGRRITVDEALAHPWFALVLADDFVPAGAASAATCNNVVPSGSAVGNRAPAA